MLLETPRVLYLQVGWNIETVHAWYCEIDYYQKEMEIKISPTKSKFSITAKNEICKGAG